MKEKISQIFSSKPRNQFDKNVCWDLNINTAGRNSEESAVKVYKFISQILLDKPCCKDCQKMDDTREKLYIIT